MIVVYIEEFRSVYSGNFQRLFRERKEKEGSGGEILNKSSIRVMSFDWSVLK